MNIDSSVLKFPTYLPNDLEGLMFFYPRKFPPVVAFYEKAAKKYYLDSKGYEEFGNWSSKELWEGFEKINGNYQTGDQDDLEFLISIDQRLHKLFCYRFWIVNYLFADGPLHDFYVDNIKVLVRKLVDMTEEVEDYEGQVLQIERDLLQSDYADLYLLNALKGRQLIEKLKKQEGIKPLIRRALNLIERYGGKNQSEIYKLLDKIIERIGKLKNPERKKILDLLDIAFEQARMRKTNFPVYTMFIHAIEFEEENIQLAERYEKMKVRIEEIFKEARARLSSDDYRLLEISYQMARNLGKYKDVMGAIDLVLLPAWFGLLQRAEKILQKMHGIKNKLAFGHGTSFYSLVWYLSSDLKAKIFSVDRTPFEIDKC